MSRTFLRTELERWLDTESIHHLIIDEFDDTALMKVLGQQYGFGLIPGASVIEKAVCTQYNIRVVGRVKTIR